MKLRIKGNSMRLRVSRSELARLLNGERIEDTIHFSAAATDSHLTYGLQFIAQTAPISVEWEPQSATVLLSEEQMTCWAMETQVGIYATVDLGLNGLLDVLVEKDFACLDRSDEENSDTFANPESETSCSRA